MSEMLPPFLQQVYDHVKGNIHHAGADHLLSSWDRFVSGARSEIPELNYNETSRILSYGEISPGCQFCRSGKWDCCFVTSQCNLNCGFCYSTNHPSQDFHGSDLGNNFLENLNQHLQLGIKGVSFSGGEALLEEDKLFNWLEMCNRDRHLEHIWLYTNGLLLNAKNIKKLSDLGLDEIRINAAATNYQHPHVISMLQKCAQHFDWVTVEIPLIPADEEKLIDAIPVWAEKGVRLLNIHEFLFEPGSNAEHFPGKKKSIVLPDGHQTAINPGSKPLALKVFHEVKAQSLSLGVNYCSTAGKWQQLTARREALLPQTMEPKEQYIGDGVLESFYALQHNQIKPISPEEIKPFLSLHQAIPVYHLTRMAPLSIKEVNKNWLSFEVLL